MTQKATCQFVPIFEMTGKDSGNLKDIIQVNLAASSSGSVNSYDHIRLTLIIFVCEVI